MGAWGTRPRFLQSRMPKAEEIGARVVGYRNVQSSAFDLYVVFRRPRAYMDVSGRRYAYMRKRRWVLGSRPKRCPLWTYLLGDWAQNGVSDVKELLKEARASDRLVFGSLSDSHSDLRSGVSRCSSGLSVDLCALVLSS